MNGDETSSATLAHDAKNRPQWKSAGYSHGS